MTSAPAKRQFSAGMTGEREEPGQGRRAAGTHDQPHHGAPILTQHDICQRFAHGAAHDAVHFKLSDTFHRRTLLGGGPARTAERIRERALASRPRECREEGLTRRAASFP